MKNLVTVIGIVFGAMLVVSQDAGAADTATPAGTATAGDIWSGCLAACQANYDEICEPAEAAVREGRITEEKAAKLCQCGVDVCTAVCMCESNGETPCQRHVSAECESLGAGMPE